MKAFLFDIGDCLEPSTEMQVKALRTLKRKFHLPKDFVKVYLEEDKYHEPHMFHAQGEPKIMKRTLKRLNLNLSYLNLTKELRKLYWEFERKFWNSDRGKQTLSALRYLKEFGKVGIISDNSFYAKVLYNKLFKEIGFKFDVFVTSAEAGAEKPNRKIFNLALKRLGLSGKECIYFGNHLERDGASKLLGMTFIFVSGYSPKGKGDFDLEIPYPTLKYIKQVVKMFNIQ